MRKLALCLMIALVLVACSDEKNTESQSVESISTESSQIESQNLDSIDSTRHTEQSEVSTESIQADSINTESKQLESQSTTQDSKDSVESQNTESHNQNSANGLDLLDKYDFWDREFYEVSLESECSTLAIKTSRKDYIVWISYGIEVKPYKIHRIDKEGDYYKLQTESDESLDIRFNDATMDIFDYQLLAKWNFDLESGLSNKSIEQGANALHLKSYPRCSEDLGLSEDLDNADSNLSSELPEQFYGKWILLESPQNNEKCKVINIDSTQTKCVVIYKRVSPINGGEAEVDYVEFDKKSNTVTQQTYWADFPTGGDIAFKKRGEKYYFTYLVSTTLGEEGAVVSIFEPIQNHTLAYWYGWEALDKSKYIYVKEEKAKELQIPVYSD